MSLRIGFSKFVLGKVLVRGMTAITATNQLHSLMDRRTRLCAIDRERPGFWDAKHAGEFMDLRGPRRPRPARRDQVLQRPVTPGVSGVVSARRGSRLLLAHGWCTHSPRP